jgi:hypothetical protein
LLYHQSGFGLALGDVMRLIWGLLLSAAIAPMAMGEELEVAAGAEYFQWQEFSDGGSRLLEETGPRYFIEVAGANPLNPDWQVDFGGRFYSGTVYYDGRTQPPSSIPVTSDTDYNGFRAEFGFTRNIRAGIEAVDARWLIRFALGLDQWRRSLQDSALPDGRTVSGYMERYASTYAKLGASYLREGVWSIGLGAKAPFHTSEKIGNFPGVNETVTLNPEGQLSLFADLSYFLTAQWRVAIGYDSYRFARSDPVAVGGLAFTQPESTQDTLSLALHYRF